MKVEKAKLADLIPDPSNARKHSDKNLDAIKGSLAKFKQQKPIVVNKDNVIIAGNGTFEAAKALGWKEIDIVRSSLKGAEALAFALADNRTSELAEWDDEVLGKQLQALYEDGFGIEDIGFDPSDIVFDHETDEKDSEQDASKKFILEIEFPDDQSLRDEYEALTSRGLIVRIKNG